MGDNTTTFLLNGQAVALTDVDPNQTLLQYLRTDAGLYGTKEGCAEGDCGACVVALGERVDDSGDEPMQWRAVNSCIRLLSSVNGKAVTTVEGLQQPGGTLHPVQQVMVDAHASQCGFCTPGFVMSLYARFQNGGADAMTHQEVDRILSGNLCRCTGYRPIIDAALMLRDVSGAQAIDENHRVARQLSRLLDNGAGAVTAFSPARAMRPETTENLLAMRSRYPDAQLIAGCTDVGLWVTKQHQRFERTIDVTCVSELQQVQITDDNRLRIGCAVNLHDAWQVLVSRWPSLDTFAARFASLPIRNAGTLGGNVANGSPIGDAMPVLLALGCTVVAGSTRGERSIALESFYKGRQQNQLAEDEVLLWLDIALPELSEAAELSGAAGSIRPADLFAYKLSRRFDQDISTVCFAMNLQLDGDAARQTVRSVRIGVGGMAATPVRAQQTEQLLTGSPWNEPTIDAAARSLQGEFSPISDMRASATYRHQVIAALLIRAWRESQGQPVSVEDV